eukprot:GEMP01007301.1.p1 GENE.GEMP01007301.1~~GEMP01007301.1.p1  ORF type:complete len:552 (+),score=63.33 GEMP01007301.1:88-1743(+)
MTSDDAVKIHSKFEGDEDEAIRDLKILIDKSQAAPHLEPPRRSANSLPDIMPSHAKALRSRDIAQPGGFRRNFMADRLPRTAKPLLQQLIDSEFQLPWAQEGHTSFCRRPSEAPLSTVDPSERPQARPALAPPLIIAIVILKVFLGGAVISFPRGFQNAGLIGGSLTLLVVGTTASVCMMMLIQCLRKCEKMTDPRLPNVDKLGAPLLDEEDAGAEMQPAPTFVDLSAHIGTWWPPIVTFLLLSSQYAFICAEQLYTGRNLHLVVLQTIPECKLWYVMVAQNLIFIPLSWIRNLAYFGFASFIANLLMFVALSYCLFFGLTTSASGTVHEQAEPINYFPEHYSTIFTFAGQCVYLYEGIGMIIPIYETARDKEKFVRILGYMLTVFTLIVLVLSIVWTHRFGSTMGSLITDDLPTSDPYVSIGIPSMFCYVVAVSTVILFPPIPQVYEPLLFGKAPGQQESNWTPVNRNALRGIIMAFSAVIGYGGGASMQNFLSIIGAACCGPLAFIVPSALYWKTMNPSWYMRLFNVVVAIFGSVITITSTYTSIQTWE